MKIILKLLTKVKLSKKVNNFEDEPQNEASLQPTSLSESQIAKYSNQFDAKIKEAASQGSLAYLLHLNYPTIP